MANISSNKCPFCGDALDASETTCPRCMMAAAMQPTEPSAEREPPTLAEVSAAFPQLEILELIGQGGMGWVFKARQPKLNRLVALKLLPASLAERDAAFSGRFEREGQLLARLHHPNIVAVHDSGTAGGFFYLLMEFVEGVNLRQAMRSSRFTPAQALRIVPLICDALQFAHDEGVLHRDIKPENILLDAKGRVKLADFGIAKLMGDPTDQSGLPDQSDQPNLTQSGTTLGTPSYMAPEQRDTPGEVDHRADIYSLGVVFFELLTGELPSESIPRPSAKSGADPRVDAIVQQAMQTERTRRQQSATEMKTQVEGVAAAPPPPPQQNDSASPMVDAILARDYKLSIRSCVRRGWALVRSDFWPFVGVTALLMAILSAAGGFSFSYSEHARELTRYSIGSTNIPLIGMVLGGPLMGGLYLYFLRRIRGLEASVETVFAGFSQRFLHLFLASFVTGALTSLGFLCFILPGIFLTVVWTFSIPLVVDRKLDFWPAMQLSRKMVSKHFWKMLGLFICLCMLAFAGFLALIVGIFIAAPICIAALMYAYEDIFGDATPTPPPAQTGTSVPPPVPLREPTPPSVPVSTVAVVGAIIAGIGMAGWFNDAFTYKRALVPSLDNTSALLVIAGSTTLGWIALAKIRDSSGQLRGKRPALFALLYIPIMLIAGLLAVALKFAGGNGLGWQDLPSAVVKPQFAFAWSALVLLSAYFLVRTAYVRLRKLQIPPDETADIALNRTFLLHSGLLAAFCTLLLMVVTRMASVFASFNPPLPTITQLTFDTAQVWGWFLFPLLLIFTAGGALIARDIGGARGVKTWSAAFICALAAGTLLSAASLMLPMRTLIEHLKDDANATTELLERK